MIREAGFSLVEMVLALAVTLMVSAGAFAIVRSAQEAAVTEPELGDLQQRLRVASEAITAELLQAGAPAAGMPTLSLPRTIPTVLPFRSGPLDPDPPATFSIDRLTVVSAAASSAQATLAQPLTPADVGVRIGAVAGCPIEAGRRDPACGFRTGASALVFDATGAYDPFTVNGIVGDFVLVQPGGRRRSHTYAAGSAIAATTTTTYYWKGTTGQLMRYNGVESDAPAIDQVAAVRFEYAGVPATPGTPLVPITAAELTDGPWRPDTADPNRYDADLLRIRRVTACLRLRPATTVSRVSELEVCFDVSPRSLIGPP